MSSFSVVSFLSFACVLPTCFRNLFLVSFLHFSTLLFFSIVIALLLIFYICIYVSPFNCFPPITCLRFSLKQKKLLKAFSALSHIILAVAIHKLTLY